MLDFFVILTKGGFRLWCYPTTVEIFRISINTFLKSLILKENSGTSPFVHNSEAIKFYMDNEFHLLFIAAYQNVLQLNYVDKFLTAIALEFRDKYKNELQLNKIQCNFDDFQSVYMETLKRIESEYKTLRSMSKYLPMRTFEQSEKSSKTVASMIVFRNKKPVERTDRKQQANKKSLHTSHIQPEPVIKHLNGSVVQEDMYAQNRKKLMEKMKSKKQKDASR
ncbi:putative Signal recognition particle receptor alpha subunit [Fasciolopsis buskii]|uniref:Putative Signal recognition particle receptor alpha subunit n=1 Tax=Fasciolopsis buskii TaxID=27845 RepID=A0A8E0S1A5_9TREM|nr:putative Signal recognition particle receptor alpha subunit [Fasciolopsis buski]